MRFADYKISHEDENSYHVVHPTGRKLVVDKKSLSEKAHATIKGMQRFSDGGLAQPLPFTPGQDYSSAPLPGDQNSESVPPAPAPQDAMQASLQAPMGGAFTPGAVAQTMPDQSLPPTMGDQGAPSESALPPQAQPDRDLASQKPSGMESALNAEKAAVTAGATAVGNEGKEESKAIKDVQGKVDALQTPEQIMQAFKAKDDSLMKAYTEQKIDPDRYLKNMGTGSKIAAGIGMLLSGFGAGASGQKNIVLEQLNKSIDSDIDAQRSDQSKSMNLWKMNREALGNDLAANLATQNQMYTGLKYKLMQAASNSKGPVALANSQAANAVIDQKIAENRQKLSLMNPSHDQNGFSNQDPARLVTQLVPEHDRDKVFKEIESAQHVATNKSKMLDLFDRAVKENTTVKRLGGLRGDPASLKTLEGMMTSQIPEIDQTVRQYAAEKAFDSFLPGRGDLASTDATKREGFINWMNSNAKGVTARGYGLDLDRFKATSKDPRAGFSDQQAELYREAADRLRRNPNDLVGRAALKKLGVTNG